MSGLPISAEARGKLRVWRSRQQTIADAVENVFDSDAAKRVSADFACKKGKGKARALTKLRQLYVGAGARQFADCFAVIAPVDDLNVVMGVTFSDTSSVYAQQVIEFSNHSLLRALQRRPGIDLTGLIWDAYDHARRVDMLDLIERPRDQFRVTAGSGAFACAVITLVSKSGHRTHVISAKTWLDTDQLSDRQEMEIAAENPASIMTFGDVTAASLVAIHRGPPEPRSTEL